MRIAFKRNENSSLLKHYIWPNIHQIQNQRAYIAILGANNTNHFTEYTKVIFYK